jgi:hypothetical protein
MYIRSDRMIAALLRRAKGILYARLTTFIAIVELGGSALSESLRDIRTEVTLSLTDILLSDSSNLHQAVRKVR